MHLCSSIKDKCGHIQLNRGALFACKVSPAVQLWTIDAKQPCEDVMVDTVEQTDRHDCKLVTAAGTRAEGVCAVERPGQQPPAVTKATIHVVTSAADYADSRGLWKLHRLPGKAIRFCTSSSKQRAKGCRQQQDAVMMLTPHQMSASSAV